MSSSLTNPRFASTPTTLDIRQRTDPETNAKKKWGNEVFEAGYQIFPDVLLRCQRFLELEAMDLLILLNITMHWWDYHDLPYPRPSTIAKRIGVSTRTVERRIAVMQARGLLVRLPSENLKGRTVRRYDLSGLVEKLRKYARKYLDDWRGPREAPTV
jgi:DNA-binding MarR family transcriptional regulator